MANGFVKYLMFVIALILSANTLHAQTPKRSFGRWLLDYITSNGITTDTLYVAKPSMPFIAKVGPGVLGSWLNVSSDDVTANLDALHKQSVALSCAWKWIGVGYSFEPQFLKVSKANKEWKFDYYWQEFGVNFLYQKIQDFDGRIITQDDRITPIDVNNALMTTLMIDVLWVFNNKKFSTPAVYDQSMVQRKSAGGWMVSSMYCNKKLRTPLDDDYEDFRSMRDFRKTFVALGGGYGYNYVTPNKKWLVHGMLMSYVSVWKNMVYDKNNIFVSDNDNGLGLEPQYFHSLKLSVLYSFRNSFLGFQGCFQSDIMYRKGFRISNSKYQTNIFYGIRFGRGRR